MLPKSSDSTIDIRAWIQQRSSRTDAWVLPLEASLDKNPQAAEAYRTVSTDPMTAETATGPRATRIAETVDAVEPELVSFVRGAGRWLDPSFPQSGRRGPNERGQWTDDDQVVTLMQQVEEFDDDGRGIRTIRLVRTAVPGGPHDGAVRVIAVGLANDAVLEVRWNITMSATEVRGKSAQLKVDGARKAECIADFHEWFGVTTS